MSADIDPGNFLRRGVALLAARLPEATRENVREDFRARHLDLLSQLRELGRILDARYIRRGPAPQPHQATLIRTDHETEALALSARLTGERHE